MNTRKATSTAFLLGIMGLSAPALAGHGLEADVDSLDAHLRATPEGGILTVRFDIDFDFDHHVYPNQPAAIFTVRDRGAALVDRDGKPLEFVVPLESPHKADDDEAEFRGEIDLELPAEALYDPGRLELLAEVVTDGNRAPLAAREERIDSDIHVLRDYSADVTYVQPAPVVEPIVTPAYTTTYVEDYPQVVVAPPPVYVAPPPVIVERDYGPRFSIGASFHTGSYGHSYGVHRSVYGGSLIRPPVCVPRPSVHRTTTVVRSPSVLHRGSLVHRSSTTVHGGSSVRRGPTTAQRGSTTVRHGSTSVRRGSATGSKAVVRRPR